jgi:hypothetical protein
MNRLALSLLLFTAFAPAATVVVNESTTRQQGYNIELYPRAVSFTLAQGYTNVVVQAVVHSGKTANSFEQVTGYLTTALGPGTTAADLVAEGTVDVVADADPQPMITILTGLTLGPGTYYFTLKGANSQASFSGVVAVQTFSVETGVGVSDVHLFHSSAPAASGPAGDFEQVLSFPAYPLMSITGDLVGGAQDQTVPEPGT